MTLSLALRRMLVTLLKNWTGYLPSTGLPIRLVRKLNYHKPEKRRETREGLQLQLTEGKEHVIVRSLGGTPVHEPEIYGILQLQSIEEETIPLICLPQRGTKLVCVIYLIRLYCQMAPNSTPFFMQTT